MNEQEHKKYNSECESCQCDDNDFNEPLPPKQYSIDDVKELALSIAAIIICLLIFVFHLYMLKHRTYRGKDIEEPIPSFEDSFQ